MYRNVPLLGHFMTSEIFMVENFRVMLLRAEGLIKSPADKLNKILNEITAR